MERTLKEGHLENQDKINTLQKLNLKIKSEKLKELGNRRRLLLERNDSILQSDPTKKNGTNSKEFMMNTEEAHLCNIKEIEIRQKIESLIQEISKNSIYLREGIFEDDHTKGNFE